MWGSYKTTYGGKWHSVWHIIDINQRSFSEWVSTLQNSLQYLWNTVVLNITLLLVENDKELNCVFLGQLPLLSTCITWFAEFLEHILLEDFHSALPLWQKETAIHLMLESRDSPMCRQLERAVLFVCKIKKFSHILSKLLRNQNLWFQQGA